MRSRWPRSGYRALLLTAALIVSLLALVMGRPLAAILILAVGVAAAIAAGKKRPRFIRRARPPAWKPTVHHPELPRPVDDPIIAWGELQAESFFVEQPPLAALPLPAALRSQLDGLALGRAKRVVEAPTLLQHAAADAESWPDVEEAVTRALQLAGARRVQLDPQGKARLTQALALCAAQGVLLAEWRQLEDGPTVWDGTAARVRASDAYAIQRLADVMRPRLLPDLFAGIRGRPPDFDLSLLVPYTMAQAFYLRLRGIPPKAFAA